MKLKDWQFIVIFAGVFGLLFLILKIFPPPGSKTPGFRLTIMTLSSTAFNNNGPLPALYTCDGDKVNPPLTISDVPRAAKTLSLTIEDPDAPEGTFIHLKPTNLDVTITQIAQGQLTNYIPPCPPPGVHHYTFILTALNDKNAVIAKSTLVGLYGTQIRH